MIFPGIRIALLLTVWLTPHLHSSVLAREASKPVATPASKPAPKPKATPKPPAKAPATPREAVKKEARPKTPATASKPAPPKPAPPVPQRRSPLAPKPDWKQLAVFNETITQKEFLRLLNGIYAPHDAWEKTITLSEEAAVIHPPGKPKSPDFRLVFAPPDTRPKPVPRYWKAPSSFKAPPLRPLKGLTIALDPGHIGGKWAQMEERWFRIGQTKPVMEGEMVLVVARHLSNSLRALGAEVVMVRSKTEPVTSVRPKALRKEAEAELRRQGIRKLRDGYNGPNDPLKFNSITWQSELLFYRTAEIRARAERVNNRIKPDLTICLHFNAEGWGNPEKPKLTDKNHLHMLVNGNYSAAELALEDVRYDMLLKLLNRSASVEIPLSESVADSLAMATGLPPFIYNGPQARKATRGPYVWSRNLLANRLFHCPVVYCEPYVMNSQPVFKHIQLGDYSGTRHVNGAMRKSIYREYADAVAEGVRRYVVNQQRHRR